jgi:hypothetical protein
MEGWRVRMGNKEWVEDPGSEIQKKPSDPGVEKAGSPSRSGYAHLNLQTEHQKFLARPILSIDQLQN